MIFGERRARTEPAAPFSGYPPRVRRLFFWYDALSDGQRVKYALVAILFLLACGGYLLGLGSTMLPPVPQPEAAIRESIPTASENLWMSRTGHDSLYSQDDNQIARS